MKASVDGLAAKRKALKRGAQGYNSDVLSFRKLREHVKQRLHPTLYHGLLNAFHDEIMVEVDFCKDDFDMEVRRGNSSFFKKKTEI